MRILASAVATRAATCAVVVAFAVAFAALPAKAAPIPLQPAPGVFQANATWQGTQEKGFVRVAPDGVMFVFFHNEQQFLLRIFNADGTPRTGDIVTAAHEGRFEGWPTVWMHPDGFLLIEWSKSSWMTTVGTWVQAFDRDGKETLPPTSIIAQQSGNARGRYVPLPDGKFMVAWPEDDGDGRAGVLSKQGTWLGAIATWHVDDAVAHLIGVAGFGALPSGDGYYAVWTSTRPDASFTYPVWVSWLDDKGRHEETQKVLDSSFGTIVADGATPGRVRFLLLDTDDIDPAHFLVSITKSTGAISSILLPDLSGYKVSNSTLDARFTDEQLMVTWNPLQGSGYPPLLATYDWKGQRVTGPLVVSDDTGRSYWHQSLDAWEGGAVVVFEGGFNGRPYDGSSVRDGSQEGLFVRRFCFAGDASCLCPYGIEDVDGDGMPDECDLCSNTDSARDAESGAVRATMGTSLLSTPVENSVSVELDFALPQGTAFHSLPIVAQGMRVVVEAATSLAPGGATVADFQVPPGLYSDDHTRGWTVRRHLFRFRDRSDTWDNGLEGVTVRERPDGRASVVLRARTGFYGLSASDPPLRATVSFGLPLPGGNACTEATFVSADCSEHTMGALACSLP